MRRVLRKGAVLLVAGVVTTVAMAWALRLDVHETRKAMLFARAGRTSAGDEISVSRREAWGAVALAAAVPGFDVRDAPPNQFVELEEAVPRWAEHELLDWARGGAPPRVRPYAGARAVLVTGWPFGAMWSSFEQQPSTGYWWFKARDGIVVGAAPPNPVPGALLSPCERVLPVRVAWGGFAACVVFWAGMWGLGVVGVPRARRVMRRRRGKCEGCGYDRRGLEAGAMCPECGRPVPRAGASDGAKA